MDITDIKDDLKQIILERLKSPIINFYLFFLVIYNWDLLLMLFFLNGDVNTKILELKNTYDDKKIFWILNWRFIAPMIYAFLSIVLFPFISNFIENLLKTITKERISNFYEIEGLKADKDLVVINKRTGNKTLENLQNEISNLTINIEKERVNYTNLSDQYTSLSDQNTNLLQVNLDLKNQLNSNVFSKNESETKVIELNNLSLSNG